MLIVWNIPLVVLSVLVAMIDSFMALTHAQRMRESSGRSAWIWMSAGGITLGLAIWTMHFIGMPAFHLPIPLGYDLPLTLLFALPAIAAALLGFYVLREPDISGLSKASQVLSNPGHACTLTTSAISVGGINNAAAH